MVGGVALYILLFLTFGILKVSYWIFVYQDFVSPYRNLPAPKKRTFLMGAFVLYWKDNDWTAGARLARENQDVPFVRFPGPLGMDNLIPTSIAGLTEILNSKVYKFVKPQTVARGFRSVLGNGLFFAEGDDHRQQRKLITPSLSLAQVRGMIPIMTRNFLHAVEILDNGKQSGEEITMNAPDFLSRLTLDIVGETSFGVSMNALSDENNSIVAAYSAISNPVDTPLIFALNSFIPGFSTLPLAANRMIARNKKVVADFCEKIVLDKRDAFLREQMDAAKEGKKVDRNKRSPDVLSYFVRDESYEWSVNEITNQMMVFLVAGHETSATAMTWAFLRLCQHPELQERARKEIREHFPNGIADIQTQDDLDKLVFITHLTNEILRIHPPIPITVREAYEDTYVQGVKIKKGTIIHLVPPQLNRDKNLWGEDADEFNPDRWIGHKAEHAYAFMTFLNGTRICIGKRMAEFELRILLAGFLGRYKIEYLVPEQSLAMPTEFIITHRPKGNLNLKFTIVGDWK
ncbi:cytochrome P450 [Dipodascopsis tothii]|uniref:cytochrome P450 n=1 Tax=Dipodascopsis tothii TaxID=44089 RepID=UPI0034CFC7D9